MLAVKPDSRNLRAGIYLKLAQRIKALEKGLDEISWTFDPLQVLNASLNFERLGVISNRYIVNFYGEETSSPLHRGVGTDRLWVSWLISTERVQRRTALVTQEKPGETRNAASGKPLVNTLADAQPQLGDPGPSVHVLSGGSWHRVIDPAPGVKADACLIEIPPSVGALKESDITLAQRWRSVVQAAFLAFFAAGFIATEFVRIGLTPDSRWFYLLYPGEAAT
jgi:predicted GNAT superfamily acetyltransferase